jgi:hypothetical protein
MKRGDEKRTPPAWVEALISHYNKTMVVARVWRFRGQMAVLSMNHRAPAGAELLYEPNEKNLRHFLASWIEVELVLAARRRMTAYRGEELDDEMVTDLQEFKIDLDDLETYLTHYVTRIHMCPGCYLAFWAPTSIKERCDRCKQKLASAKYRKSHAYKLKQEIKRLAREARRAEQGIIKKR